MSELVYMINSSAVDRASPSVSDLRMPMFTLETCTSGKVSFSRVLTN
jgi:hypothetical protein